jgi:hypothetical protein
MRYKFPIFLACLGALLTICALFALVRTQEAYRYLVYLNPLGTLYGPYLVGRILPIGEFGSRQITYFGYNLFLTITSGAQWFLIGLGIDFVRRHAFGVSRRQSGPTPH